jgi:hypothetical protein
MGRWTPLNSVPEFKKISLQIVAKPQLSGELFIENWDEDEAIQKVVDNDMFEEPEVQWPLC